MIEPPESACLRTLWKQHLEQAGDKIFVAFAKPPAPDAASDTPLEFDRYTFSDVDRLVRQMAFEYARILPARKRGEPQRTVAFTSETSLGYVVNELALARLGHAVLLVSANNSAAAIADLVKKTGSDTIVHSPKLARVCHEASQLLSQEGKEVGLYEEMIVQHGAESNRNPDEAPQSELTHEEEQQSIFFLLHSSGSTSFPKALAFSQQMLIKGYKAHWGDHAVLSTVPLCHAYGSHVVWGGLIGGKTSYILPASVPLTLKNLVNALKGCEAQQFNAVPYTLKLFAASPEARDILAERTKFVVCAGSSCPKEVGDALVAAGVNLIDVYGSTECSGFFRCAREVDKKHSWRTHYIIPEAKPFVVMEEVDGDLFEPVIKPGWPRTLVKNRPDGSYAMGDLFKRDPTVEDGYVYVGRKDDTLVHLGGEKTNPVPMESKIRESPWVSDAMVFGAGKTQTGALILLTEEAEKSGRQDAFQLVWPAVQAANAEAPSHSRLLPEMVRLLPSSAKFVTVDKMSIVRVKTVAKYQDLIDDIYWSFEEGDEACKETLNSFLHARQVVRKIVCACIESDDITDTQDVFDYGIDSITSERILATLRRTIALGDRKLSPLFVFENPTIARMTASLLKGSDDGEDQSTTMKELVAKYFAQIKLQDHPGSFVHQSRAHTVVLTGATGALGAHLLHQLCQNKHVKVVYCLCRAQNDKDARQRLVTSLTTRGLPPLGTLPEHSKILALASDLTKADLGLVGGTFATMQREVTSVIHCGWPVNFNMSLRSFESSIQGAVNLINLCVDSCGAFLFCSSVSTMGRYPGHEIPEEISTDPKVAMTMGYAQSKWVVENLCLEALKRKGLESAILRIGQMSADTQNGIWNDKEAIPLTIKGIELVHSMPDTSNQQVNWLPVDKAASMIVKLLEPQITLRTMAGVYHITSRKDTPWSTIYQGLRAAGLKFDLLPPHEWLQKLQAAKKALGDAASKSNPVLKLLEHFGRQYAKAEPQPGPAATDHPAVAPEQPTRVFVQAQVKDEARAARDFMNYVWTEGLTDDWHHDEPVSEDDVVKMVQAWKASGFLA